MSSRPAPQIAAAIGFLRLNGIGARLIGVLFAITIGTLAVVSGSTQHWEGVVSLILVIAAGALAVTRGGYPVSLPITFAILAIVGVSTALVTLELPLHERMPGYTAWHLGANTFLLLTLSIRGRVAWAWIGLAMMFVITATWSTVSGQGTLFGIDMVDRHAGTLLIGTLFAIGIRRTAARVAAYHRDEEWRLAQEQSARASIAERNQQADDLDHRAGDTLRRIAAGGIESAADRLECRILEAELRDRIRARTFAVDSLVTEVSLARRRGVNVLLLDDTMDAVVDDPTRERIAEWVATHLHPLAAGEFTARIRAGDTGELVLSAVTEQGAHEVTL